MAWTIVLGAISQSTLSSMSDSPASLLELDVKSLEEVSVSALDSEVEEPRRRWPKSRSRADAMRAIF